MKLSRFTDEQIAYALRHPGQSPRALAGALAPVG
jgi:hypothetical protein